MTTDSKMIIPEGMKKCITCNDRGRRYRVLVNLNLDNGVICKCEDCHGKGYTKK
ncbi:MAG: hypothetical protein HFJ60_06960 [Clostridia bacterium]|nr:hypothetical protein [Clostridia bacterium]